MMRQVSKLAQSWGRDRGFSGGGREAGGSWGQAAQGSWREGIHFGDRWFPLLLPALVMSWALEAWGTCVAVREAEDNPEGDIW